MTDTPAPHTTATDAPAFHRNPPALFKFEMRGLYERIDDIRNTYANMRFAVIAGEAVKLSKSFTEQTKTDETLADGRVAQDWRMAMLTYLEVTGIPAKTMGLDSGDIHDLALACHSDWPDYKIYRDIRPAAMARAAKALGIKSERLTNTPS